jgi:hypothetical protein
MFFIMPQLRGDSGRLGFAATEPKRPGVSRRAGSAPGHAGTLHEGLNAGALDAVASPRGATTPLWIERPPALAIQSGVAAAALQSAAFSRQC